MPRNDRSNGRYILKGKTPVPEPDLLKWAQWFEEANNRVVKQDTINGYFVSTVFLGLDHDFGFGGAPILFESMVFGGRTEIMDRYCTWEQAERGHKQIVRRVSRWKIKGSRCEPEKEKPPKLRAIEL
jgi:hypothetical protein